MIKIATRISVLLLFCVNCFAASAQETDYGTWMSIEVSKKLTKKITVEIEEEIRVFKNLGEIDRFASSVGGVYAIQKYLKGGIGYTWLYNHNLKDDVYENRHRFYAYLQGQKEFGRFNFSLREKFQSSFYDKSIAGYKYSPRNYLRSRLNIGYDIRKSKIQPFVTVEMHYQLNDPLGNEIDNMRYTVGAEFPLAKKLKLDTFFRLNQEINTSNPEHLYLMGLNLKWKL